MASRKMIFIPKSLMHMVLSRRGTPLCVCMCTCVHTGMCTETAKVKTLMDQEAPNTANVKVLSLTHMPSQAGH